MEYVVVGAGAIGGTIGARLARDGHGVLLCDADAEHVAAMNARGLAIEGPVEEFTVPARGGRAGWAAGRARRRPARREGTAHRRCARRDRAASRAATASSSRCRTASTSRRSPRASARTRTVGAFVNFGADYLAPGPHLRRRPRTPCSSASSTDARAIASSGSCATCRRREEHRRTSSASSGRRRPTARCSSRPRSPTSRSRTRSPSLVTGRSSSRLAQEVLALAPVAPEPFDGFDPDDVEGSIDASSSSTGARRRPIRRSTATSPCASGRPRRRCSRTSTGRCVRRTLELIHAIEDGGRVCEAANLELLAAYARLDERRAAAERGDERPAAGRARGRRAAARRARRGEGQHRRPRRRDDERVDRRRSSARERATPRSSRGCERRARSSSARRTCSSTPPAASTPPTG